MKITSDELQEIALRKIRRKMYDYQEQKWMSKSAGRVIKDKRKKKKEKYLKKEIEEYLREEVV